MSRLTASAKTEQDLKLMAAAIQRKKKLEILQCLDPNNPESRPSPVQQTILEEFGQRTLQLLRAGNQSGKTSIGARTVSWLMANNHPYWTKPADWGEEPLQFLVLGRNSKQIEESLYRRIRGYFSEGELREIRTGNVLQAVEHRTTKNKIIFQTYENERQARERVQSYTLHFVWVDEQPSLLALIDECLRRVQAKNGYMLMTFTPLIVSHDVRKFLDNMPEHIGKTYRFNMLRDNPIYKDPARQAELLAQMANLPEHVRKSRLDGDWMAAENTVYYFDYESMVEAPVNYSPAWRHVESSDPAVSSAHGLTIWAEDPTTGTWYLVKAEQLVGMPDPQAYAEKVKELTSGVNIVRRIYDSASPWYSTTATRLGMTYMGVYHKTNRKMELINNLQMKLGREIKIAPWCTDFIEQLTSCHWSETIEGKVAKASRWHLLDSATYFADLIPKYEGKSFSPQDRGQWIRSEFMKHKAKTQQTQAKPRNPLLKSGGAGRVQRRLGRR